MKAYILVGLPASGKSTYTSKIKNENTFVFSTDDYIEAKAKDLGKTYNDMFRETISEATKEMNIMFYDAIKNKKDIIIDRTNMTTKSRNKYTLPLNKAGYEITIVVFPLPKNEEEKKLLQYRLNSRPGKNIPASVIESMTEQFEYPDSDLELFDNIEEYKWY
jgi:predicted kinase